MSSACFKEASFYDGARVVTLEDSIKLCGAFAGIHDYEFADAVDDDFSGLSDWIICSAITHATGVSELSGYPSDLTHYWEAAWVSEVAPSFAASFDLKSGQGGFFFRGKTDTSVSEFPDSYAFWWDSNNCGMVRIDAARNATDIIKMPYGITAPARIRVSVRYDNDYLESGRRWMLASLYVDGSVYVTGAHSVSDAVDWDGNEIGFIFKGGALSVDNFRIPEAHRIVKWTQVDPGETPLQGMNRAIATTRLARMSRYNGTMRVWRPGDRSSDWNMPDSKPVKFSERKEYSSVRTHIRTLGSMHEVDVFNKSEGDVHMHRFHLHNDPNVGTELETYNEGFRAMHESLENQRKVRIIIPLNPLIEPYDVITYDGTDYRVLSVSHQLSLQGRQVVALTNIDARLYLPLGVPPDRS